MSSLTFANGAYQWRGTFEAREMPKSAGFEWNKTARVWQTDDPFIAARTGIPCPELQPVLDRVARSQATQPAYLDPDGLYPYQAAGVEVMQEEFALGRKAMLLADQPGLGKTPQTARLADAMGWKNLLVICPASLRLNWIRELERWRKYGSEPVAVLDSKRFPRAGCTVVVSYDIFTRDKWPGVLSLYPFDALICDESHFLKELSGVVIRGGVGDLAGRVVRIDAVEYVRDGVLGEQDVRQAEARVLGCQPDYGFEPFRGVRGDVHYGLDVREPHASLNKLFAKQQQQFRHGVTI